ncbi:hypothetical protein GCM10027517_08500 [Phycicoccus ginsengisoli]
MTPERVASLLATMVREVSDRQVSIDRPRCLCLAAAALVEADGVAMTMAYASPDRVTLCATDDIAARLEDLQDVLSQGRACSPPSTACTSGPCWTTPRTPGGPSSPGPCATSSGRCWWRRSPCAREVRSSE